MEDGEERKKTWERVRYTGDKCHMECKVKQGRMEKQFTWLFSVIGYFGTYLFPRGMHKDNEPLLSPSASW